MACGPNLLNSVSATSTNWNSGVSPIAIGFFGFGEAGSHIAKGLKSAGLSRIFAFDIAPEKVRARSIETGIPLLSSNRELAESAQILFSTVTCARAKEAAEQTAPFLTARHIYAD